MKPTEIDAARPVLRHLVATLTYRAAKVLRERIRVSDAGAYAREAEANVARDQKLAREPAERVEDGRRREDGSVFGVDGFDVDLENERATFQSTATTLVFIENVGMLADNGDHVLI